MKNEMFHGCFISKVSSYSNLTSTITPWYETEPTCGVLNGELCNNEAILQVCERVCMLIHTLVNVTALKHGCNTFCSDVTPFFHINVLILLVLNTIYVAIMSSKSMWVA